MSGVSNLLERLKIIKDLDPFNKRLLNDCYDTVKELKDEVDRLRYHNNTLMNVIYQNNHEMENVDVTNGE